MVVLLLRTFWMIMGSVHSRFQLSRRFLYVRFTHLITGALYENVVYSLHVQCAQKVWKHFFMSHIKKKSVNIKK